MFHAKVVDTHSKIYTNVNGKEVSTDCVTFRVHTVTTIGNGPNVVADGELELRGELCGVYRIGRMYRLILEPLKHATASETQPQVEHE